jgi:hypothetical protein
MLLKLATQTQMKNRTAAVMASISVSVNFGRLSIALPRVSRSRILYQVWVLMWREILVAFREDG